MYSRGDVAKHASDEDLWVIIDQNVYDLTEWLNFHPGGRDVLLSVAGQDATEHFQEIGHSPFAKEKMTQFLVGVVVEPKRFSGSEYREREGEV